MTFEEAVACWKNQTPVMVPRIGNGMRMKLAFIREKPDHSRTELFMDDSGTVVCHQLVCVEGIVTRYKHETVGRRKFTVPLSSVRPWVSEG